MTKKTLIVSALPSFASTNLTPLKLLIITSNVNTKARTLLFINCLQSAQTGNL